MVPSRRRQRRAAFFLSVFLIGVLVLLFSLLWRRRPKDPLFEGHRLSALLSQAYRAPGQQVRHDPCFAEYVLERAVQTLGTNAVPLLQAWLASERSGKVAKLHDALSWHIEFLRPVDRAVAAARASGFLGVNGAEMLLPLLQRLTNSNPSLAYYSAQSLQTLCLRIKPPNETTLFSLIAAKTALDLSILKNQFSTNDQSIRQEVANSLSQAIRSYDNGGILQHLVKVRTGAPDWRRSARVLSRQQQFPEIIIPVLEHELARNESQYLENALLALRNYRGAAKHLDPEVRPFLLHTNANIRAAAHAALSAISSSEITPATIPE